jgi:trehalose-6-phosphate synthase
VKRKSIRTFIKEHREELDAAIARALKMDKNPRANDEERRLWVLNDEGLYNWARSEGVEI